MTFQVATIEKFKTVPTPFYYYDLGLLKDTLKNILFYSQKYNFIVHYALKANANEPILTLIKDAGLGADCVSGNEILRALQIGFSPQHIAFAGVGKTDEEIKIGLTHDIFSFNCESIQELEVINSLAQQMGKKASVSLRLNPNVAANTHHYITTGLEENKFGINPEDLSEVIEKLQSLSFLSLTGIHFHIGSQITDLDNFKSLCLKINELQTFFEGKNIILHHVNVGGGLGINYTHPNIAPIADFASYFQTFHKYLHRKPRQEVHFELGRAIVGQCGSLITKVLYIKKGKHKQFVITDAGMTELIRPTLYQAYHQIENLTCEPQDTVQLYDIVGPICESSDYFGKDRPLPLTQRGDLLAIRSAGAYGEVMASEYNLREKVKFLYS